MRHGSLFSGYLGLDMAAQAVFPGSLSWVCEIDKDACKILDERAPEIPNLGDITAVDWSTVEPVDILTAGWPCQPFSLAGKRKGSEDDRALWPYVTDAIRHLRPGVVVLENVAAIVTAGELERVVSSLAALGYVGSWRCVRASDAGAPHRRARLFVVATDSADGPGFRGVPQSTQRYVQSGNGQGPSPATDAHGLGDHRSGEYRPGWWPEFADGRGFTPDAASNQGRRSHGDHATAADAYSGQPQRRRGPGELGIPPSSQSGQGGQRQWAGDTARSGRATDWGPYGHAIRRWERVTGRAAPAPTERNRTGGQRLSPRFVEWMMGLSEGWVTEVPGLTRSAQLKALGNGVVPQQATLALELMGV